MSVSCVRWGGDGLLFSGSQDRTIKVWAPDETKLVRSLDGHAHWVNTLALSTDAALRVGGHDHRGVAPPDLDAQAAAALLRAPSTSEEALDALADSEDGGGPNFSAQMTPLEDLTEAWSWKALAKWAGEEIL